MVQRGFLNENQVRALLSEDWENADVDEVAGKYRLSADAVKAIVKRCKLYEPVPDEDGTLRGYWVIPPLSDTQKLMLQQLREIQ